LLLWRKEKYPVPLYCSSCQSLLPSTALLIALPTTLLYFHFDVSSPLHLLLLYYLFLHLSLLLLYHSYSLIHRTPTDTPTFSISRYPDDPARTDLGRVHQLHAPLLPLPGALVSGKGSDQRSPSQLLLPTYE
jgi:hypothetical protein